MNAMKDGRNNMKIRLDKMRYDGIRWAKIRWDKISVRRHGIGRRYDGDTMG